MNEITRISTKDETHVCGAEELRIFRNTEFGRVRTVLINDTPYFVGKDVAEILGYSNPRKAIGDHVDEEDKGVTKCDTLGGAQELTVINESGLYSLILSSKMPNAKRFKRWVTSEVLPSIRKHGMYAVDELLENPDIAIKAFTALKEERVKNKRLEEEKKALEIETIEMNKTISELQPKANYVDVILQNKSTVLVTQIAQDYGMSARAFNKILYDLEIQRKVGGQWILYSKYQGHGYVHSHTIDITRANGMPDVKMQTEWTQKGRLFLYEKLIENNIYPMIEKAV